MKQDYIETVRLLIDIAPDIFESPRFAMKGGTALNLFLQDMPRLSVDIDVVFVDHTLSRDDALQAIASDLQDACVRLAQRGYDVAIPKRPAAGDFEFASYGVCIGKWGEGECRLKWIK